MAKIDLDKYYTPIEIARYCYNKAIEVIGIDNISEFLEPSAGAGVFLGLFEKPYKALDIAPESEGIVKIDYLKAAIPYKKGRCVIGNPPFGERGHTAMKFYKKAVYESDYIAFILPISQLDNNTNYYEFDLIHSEDLGGNTEYSGVKVHCCFNIYERSLNGINKRKPYLLNDISLHGVGRGESRNDKVPEKYDFSICGFGASGIGKFAEMDGQYAHQIYITVNRCEIKDCVKSIIANTDWGVICKGRRLTHWRLLKHLKDNIPDLK